jgi:hypothetical protein
MEAIMTHKYIVEQTAHGARFPLSNWPATQDIERCIFRNQCIGPGRADAVSYNYNNASFTMNLCPAAVSSIFQQVDERWGQVWLPAF